MIEIGKWKINECIRKYLNDDMKEILETLISSGPCSARLFKFYFSENFANFHQKSMQTVFHFLESYCTP